jgi:hypothetical protein
MVRRIGVHCRMCTRRFVAAVVLPLTFLGCDGATMAELRIDPRSRAAGQATAEYPVLKVVRDALPAERYVCVQGHGDVLLKCAPRDSHPELRAVVKVDRVDSGYSIRIDAIHEPTSRLRPEVCDLARRIAADLESSLGSRSVQYVVRGERACRPDGS